MDHPALAFFKRVETRHPNAWRAADDFRQKVLNNEPVHREGSIFSRAEAEMLSMKLAKDADTFAFSPIALGAMVAWRPSKGIYRFNSALYEAVIGTEIGGEVPSHLLTRLPSYAVFIETPSLSFFSQPIHGFWAYLSRMGKQESLEIVALFQEGEPHGLSVPLGNHPVSDLAEMAIKGMFEDSEIEYELTSDEWAEVKSSLSAMLSLLLYLCSEKPDIDNWQPSVPQMKFLGTKRRLLQSKEVKTWEVGLRIGAAFVLAKKSSSGSGGDGSSSSVRPHIRRAHWHSFWVGQRGEQTISLRWLPPILVNVEDIENLPAVIHPVVTSTESRETR